MVHIETTGFEGDGKAVCNYTTNTKFKAIKGYLRYRQNPSGPGSAPLFRKHNINGTPGATGYRLFRALTVFMDLRLSIFPLVDLSFFCRFERIHKVKWECAYH